MGMKVLQIFISQKIKGFCKEMEYKLRNLELKDCASMLEWMQKSNL